MMIDQPGSPGNPQMRKPRATEGDLYEAAWNAAAIASTHWQQSTAALASVLASAQDHGLSVVELSAATGLDHATVVRLTDAA